MSYKLGFYFNLPFENLHNYLFIVVFENGHLSFRLFPNRKSFLSFRYIRCFKMSYYSFDHPILYKEDSGCISEITLLQDIPIATEGSLKKKGLEIYVPFYDGRSFESIGLRDSVFGLGRKTSDNFFDTSVYLDGQDLFCKDKAVETLEYCFFKVVLVHYILNSIVSQTERYTRSRSSIDFYKERISRLKDYIDRLDLDFILKDYQVNVEEHFIHKVGGDDSYYAYRTASVGECVDMFLSELLGLGKKEICSYSGYCCAESMAIPGLVTGNYEGENLEKEKMRIKKEYSKEVHLATLLSIFCVAVNTGFRDLPFVVKDLDLFRTALFEDFKLKAISNESKNFEKLFYSFLHNRIRDHIEEKRRLNDINSLFLETTRNSFTAETLAKLNSVPVYYDPYSK